MGASNLVLFWTLLWVFLSAASKKSPQENLTYQGAKIFWMHFPAPLLSCSEHTLISLLTLARLFSMLFVLAEF